MDKGKAAQGGAGQVLNSNELTKKILIQGDCHDRVLQRRGP